MTKSTQRYPYNLMTHLMGFEMVEEKVSVDMLDGLEYALQDIERRYHWGRNIQMYRQFFETDMNIAEVALEFKVNPRRLEQIFVTVTRSIRKWYLSYFKFGYYFTCTRLYEDGLLDSIDPNDINTDILEMDFDNPVSIIAYLEKIRYIDFFDISSMMLSEQSFIPFYMWVNKRVTNIYGIDPTVEDVFNELRYLFCIYGQQWYLQIPLSQTQYREIEGVFHFTEVLRKLRK